MLQEEVDQQLGQKGKSIPSEATIKDTVDAQTSTAMSLAPPQSTSAADLDDDPMIAEFFAKQMAASKKSAELPAKEWARTIVRVASATPMSPAVAQDKTSLAASKAALVDQLCGKFVAIQNI